MSERVVVVGAGIAGIACARQLAAVGVAVSVLDRESTVGGRMASPVVHGRPVDLGAAYFTARDPEFAAVVAGWQAAGLVRPWTAELAVLSGGRREREPDGPQRWAAPGGLQSLVADLARDLPVDLNHPVRDVTPGSAPAVDGEVADAVVLAMPQPQAAALLPGLVADPWRAVTAVALGYPERTWPPFHAAFVNDHPALTLIADDGDRRGDGAPVLVAHTRGEPDPAAVAELLGIRDDPLWMHTRRWPHAAPERPRTEPFLLRPDGIAFAGDAWGSPRVETAWRSGTLLGLELAHRLG